MTKLVTAAALIAALALPAFAAEPPKTEEEKTLYSIGAYQARQLGIFNLTPEEFAMVQRGFADGAPGKQPLININEYEKKVQELVMSRRAKAAAATKSAGEAARDVLTKAAAQKGAVKTASGLVYFTQREGTGTNPGATSSVRVHYRGTLPDGREFDNTASRRQPAEFKLDGVIKCWSEGLQLMKAGGKAKLICPPELGYGEKGVEGVIPPNSPLIFEIDLLAVEK